MQLKETKERFESQSANLEQELQDTRTQMTTVSLVFDLLSCILTLCLA